MGQPSGQYPAQGGRSALGRSGSGRGGGGRLTLVARGGCGVRIVWVVFFFFDMVGVDVQLDDVTADGAGHRVHAVALLRVAPRLQHLVTEVGAVQDLLPIVQQAVAAVLALARVPALLVEADKVVPAL